MAAPTYSPGTPGNVLSVASLAAGKNAAALVDLSTTLGGAVHCKMTAGATAPAAGTTFALNRVVAATKAAPNATLTAAAASGAGTLSVSSIAGIAAGQKVALIPAAGGAGEIVTVASASGSTLTLSGVTAAGYQSGDLVLVIEQAASGGTVTPGNAWAANTTYSTSIYPPPAWLWVLVVTNGDGAQAVAVSSTLDTNPAFA